MSLSVPLARYVGNSTDLKPNDPNIAIGTQFVESDTKQVLYWTGSAWKTIRQRYKTGRWVALGTLISADNILESLLTGASWSSTRTFDPTYGLHLHISTTNGAGNYAGMRTAAGYTEPRHNPYLRIVFALDTGGTLNNFNFFLGWANHVSALGDNNSGADDIYPNNSAFGLKFRGAETHFKLYHNHSSSGAGSMETIAPANSPTLTSIHTIELRSIGAPAAPTFQYKFDHNPSWTTVTGNNPDSTNFLALQMWIQTTAAAFKLFRLVDIYTRMDNKG